MPRLHVWAVGAGCVCATGCVTVATYHYFTTTKLAVEQSIEAEKLFVVKFHRKAELLQRKALAFAAQLQEAIQKKKKQQQAQQEHQFHSSVSSSSSSSSFSTGEASEERRQQQYDRQVLSDALNNRKKIDLYAEAELLAQELKDELSIVSFPSSGESSSTSSSSSNHHHHSQDILKKTQLVREEACTELQLRPSTGGPSLLEENEQQQQQRKQRRLQYFVVHLREVVRRSLCYWVFLTWFHYIVPVLTYFANFHHHPSSKHTPTKKEDGAVTVDDDEDSSSNRNTSRRSSSSRPHEHDGSSSDCDSSYPRGWWGISHANLRHWNAGVCKRLLLLAGMVDFNQAIAIEDLRSEVFLLGQETTRQAVHRPAFDELNPDWKESQASEKDHSVAQYRAGKEKAIDALFSQRDRTVYVAHVWHWAEAAVAHLVFDQLFSKEDNSPRLDCIMFAEAAAAAENTATTKGGDHHPHNHGQSMSAASSSSSSFSTSIVGGATSSSTTLSGKKDEEEDEDDRNRSSSSRTLTLHKAGYPWCLPPEQLQRRVEAKYGPGRDFIAPLVVTGAYNFVLKKASSSSSSEDHHHHQQQQQKDKVLGLDKSSYNNGEQEGRSSITPSTTASSSSALGGSSSSSSGSSSNSSVEIATLIDGESVSELTTAEQQQMLLRRQRRVYEGKLDRQRLRMEREQAAREARMREEEEELLRSRPDYFDTVGDLSLSREQRIDALLRQSAPAGGYGSVGELTAVAGGDEATTATAAAVKEGGRSRSAGDGQESSSPIAGSLDDNYAGRAVEDATVRTLATNNNGAIPTTLSMTVPSTPSSSSTPTTTTSSTPTITTSSTPTTTTSPPTQSRLILGVRKLEDPDANALIVPGEKRWKREILEKRGIGYGGPKWGLSVGSTPWDAARASYAAKSRSSNNNNTPTTGDRSSSSSSSRSALTLTQTPQGWAGGGGESSRGGGVLEQFMKPMRGSRATSALGEPLDHWNTSDGQQHDERRRRLLSHLLPEPTLIQSDPKLERAFPGKLVEVLVLRGVAAKEYWHTVLQGIVRKSAEHNK